MPKDLTLSPLTGVLDLRSSPDSLPRGAVRMRQNLRCTGEGKLTRGTGWSKLLSQSSYNNADFHDQLLVFGSGTRQPVTLIAEAQSTAGVRSLFIGQQTRLFRLSEHGGNWKMLGSGFGGDPSTSASAPRFRSARLGDYMAFTNDYDRPKYHILEQQGSNGESLYDFDDLATIGLTRAKHVWVWRKFLIFANVEMDGRRQANRLVSSSFDNPLQLDPANAEYSGFDNSLDDNEEIVGGAESGNSFLIYTTKGIWVMNLVGGDQVVSFNKAYNGLKNDMKGVLAYPNILAQTADGHLFGSDDGLYFFNQFMAKPERPEWLHRSSALLYDRIDRSACEVHCAGILGDEVYISVAQNGQTNALPNVTLRINFTYKVCDKVDTGFSAYCNFQSQDVQSVRDFIIENRICTLEGLTALGYGYVNEGLPNPLPVGNAAFEPMSIHTLAPLQMFGTLTVASAGTAAANGSYVWNLATRRYEKSTGYYISTTSDGTTRTWKLFNNSNVLQYSNTTTVAGTWATTNGGTNPKPAVTLGLDVVTTEDYEKTDNDSDSLCALLGDEILDAGCRGCRGETLFVGASSSDLCLKQIGGVFYREVCANPSAVGGSDVQVVPSNSAVDIVFVVDESGSLAAAKIILAAIAANIESQLNAAGVGSGDVANRYACVAFGHGDPAEQEIAFTNSTAFAAAAGSIGLSGGVLEEDAYEGIDFAINDMPWRDDPAVSKVIFFLTDEDRNQHYYTDGANQTAQFASLKTQIVDGGFVLAGMIPTEFSTPRSSDNLIVMAGDWSGRCYVADGAGGYIEKSGLHIVGGDGIWSTSVTFATGIYAEYYLLLLDPDIQGYFFELNNQFGYLAGAPTSTSVLAVIVPALTERITNEVSVMLYQSSMGSYILDGYDSIFIPAPLFVQKGEVQADVLTLNAVARTQTPPSNISLRVGISGQVVDPNDSACMVWHQHSSKSLRCQSDYTETQHKANNTQPALTYTWNLERRGPVLYFELKVSGTGGDVDFSLIDIEAHQLAARRY